MSVLIRGMEMPDCGYVCLKVFANGEVLMTKEQRGALVITGIKDKVGTAIPVPPHGRLIDQDMILREVIHGDYPNQWIDKNELLRLFRNAPTIIEAEVKE